MSRLDKTEATVLTFNVMRNFINILGLSLVFSCLCGCIKPQTQQPSTSTDSWFDPPSEWSRFRQAKSLPDSEVSEVAPEHMAAGEEQLLDVACVEITADRAAELTGRAMPPQAGSSLFLVRALYLNRGTGKFMVVPVGSELLVEHGSLGRSAVPMKRQALAVRLSQRPKTVYVSCSMDE
jgi:hypothetical protein